MPNTDKLNSSPQGIMELFPDQALVIGRLLLRDRKFRGLCEDYMLAHDTLANFHAMTDSVSDEIIAEYRLLLSELEAEISASLRVAKEHPGP
jgi:hypothetical protein